MIEVVTFDLWNTIFLNKSYRHSRLNFLMQFLKEKQKSFSTDKIKHEFDSAFYLSDTDFDNPSYPHLYTKERILRLLHTLNIELSKSEIIQIETKLEEIMLIDPPLLKFGVEDTLKELASDYKIGLISNTGITPGRVIKKVFQNYDIQKYFRITLFSDETGFYKPNPIMFETILNEFNCKPINAMHIGDLLETDIKGADDCNILTIWVNDSKSQESRTIKPDYEVQQICDVVDIIKKIT